MTRFLMTAAALIAVVGVDVRAGTPNPSSDLGRLQGRWEAKAGKRVEFQVVLEIEGNQATATITPKVGPTVRATGEIKLDEGVSPRSIDWVNFATRDGQDLPPMLAIYRVDGDKFTLKNGGFNDSRPESFEGLGEGIWTQTVEFRRAPATASAPTTRVASQP